MTGYGYTLMTEQSGPRDIVRYAAAAERAGFDFEVMSDHYSPWLDEQGHASYAWAMLGAITQVTERVELMTYVTCPTMRYHPAVVAQKAATVQALSEGRFTLGLGAGENLNEHIVGGGWPPANVRHEMFCEALEIISALFDGGYVDYAGSHFRVDAAKLWDLPETRVPIGVAVSGQQSVDRFAPLADHLIAVEPEAELVRMWDEAAQGKGRRIGQVPICWDTDRERAVTRAHEQSAGSAAAGRSTPSCPGPPASPAPPSSCVPRTSPTPSRAGPTSRGSWRRSGSSSRPASPTSRWCRWATRGRRSSSRSPRRSCSPRCGAGDARRTRGACTHRTRGAQTHSTVTPSATAGRVTSAESAWNSRVETRWPCAASVRRHSRLASEPV